jgi:hypothetical protein
MPRITTGSWLTVKGDGLVPHHNGIRYLVSQGMKHDDLLVDIVFAYYNASNRVGMNWTIALAHAAFETNHFTLPLVKVNNFANINADFQSAATFQTVRAGVEAHVNAMVAYATAEYERSDAQMAAVRDVKRVMPIHNRLEGMAYRVGALGAVWNRWEYLDYFNLHRSLAEYAEPGETIARIAQGVVDATEWPRKVAK